MPFVITAGKAFVKVFEGHLRRGLDTIRSIRPAVGNTETGVFVKQVKLGISFAEVDAALGVPQTRVDLGEKILYKYKDMVVEFHDCKVTDVR